MGVEQTRGHTADGGGLRGHSVGDFYPYIVYATGPTDNLRWHVMAPNGHTVGITNLHSARLACILARRYKKHDEKQAIAASHGDPLCYGV